MFIRRVFNKATLREPAPVMMVDSDVHCTAQTSSVKLESQSDITALQQCIRACVAPHLGVYDLPTGLLLTQLDTGAVVLLGTAELLHSDYADQLIKLASQRYTLHKPARLQLHAASLISISRSIISGTTVHPRSAGGERQYEDEWSQAELYEAFLDVVTWGVDNAASDIHLTIRRREPYSELRFTVSGRYISPARFQGVSTSMLQAMAAVAWMRIEGGNGAVFDPFKEQQGRLTCRIKDRDVLLRWASMAAEDGPSVCLRIVAPNSQDALPTISQLGYLPQQQLEINQSMLADGGAILFSGVVGSGKSTSLASLASTLPAWHKLITLEDPVEQRIPFAIQNSLVRDLSQTQHDSFATKLRTLKRSAMTDVLLGEIRDIETGRAFSDLVSAGVRVYSTVHAGAASLIPQRLVSDFIGVSAQLLSCAGVLRLLIHQMLVPRLCDSCSIPIAELSAYPAHAVGHYYAGIDFIRWQSELATVLGGLEGARVRSESGCQQCLNLLVPELSGYQGRTVIAEILNPVTNTAWLQSPSWPSPNTGLNFASGDINDVARQKCRQGEIDPFDIEHRLGAWAVRK